MRYSENFQGLFSCQTQAKAQAAEYKEGGKEAKAEEKAADEGKAKEAKVKEAAAK